MEKKTLDKVNKLVSIIGWTDLSQAIKFDTNQIAELRFSWIFFFD